MSAENCFFYHNQESNKIRPICVNCYQNNLNTPKEIKGWYWEGKDGYGPFLFECDLCQKTIHDGREESQESLSE